MLFLLMRKVLKPLYPNWRHHAIHHGKASCIATGNDLYLKDIAMKGARHLL